MSTKANYEKRSDMKGTYPRLGFDNEAEAAMNFYVVQTALDEPMSDREKPTGVMTAQRQTGKRDVPGLKNAAAA